MRSIENYQRLIDIQLARSAEWLCQGNFDDAGPARGPSTLRQPDRSSVHFRDAGMGQFIETFDDGQTDMVECMRLSRHQLRGRVAPDHVPTMASDANDTPRSSIGLFAIGYIKGLEAAYRRLNCRLKIRRIYR